MNRIVVTAAGKHISAQARTYAEYRVFSTLTRSVPDFRHARVTLRQRSEDGTYDVVTCEMTVSLEASGTLRIRTAGPHVYAAINRAVERLAHVVGGEQLDQRRYG